jgi:hypothetical protein
VTIILMLWWSLARGNHLVPSRWQATVGREKFDVGQLADEADLIGGVRTCLCGDDAADCGERCGDTERDACPSGH